MPKNDTRLTAWGKRLLFCGIVLLVTGLVLLLFAPPFFAVWILVLSVLVNAAAGCLLGFGKKKE